MNKNILFDLESNLGKIGTKDILFQDINSIIDGIIDTVDKLLNRNFEYETNLAQHLNNYKKENDLSKLSEKDKIVNFVQYLHNKEFEYVTNYKKEILKHTSVLSMSFKIQKTKLNKNINNSISENKSKKWYEFYKKDSLKEQNKEIYEFKFDNLVKILNKVDFFEANIYTMNNCKQIDLDISERLKIFDNLYTLEQFVLDNEYSKSTPNYLKLGTLDNELKSELLQFKNNLISLKKSINNKPTYEQIDLMVNRLTMGKK